jgi:VWFA-related protein
MTSARPLAAALAGILVYAAATRAADQQQPPPPPPPADSTQKPVFRTGAELVRVDVVVLDKKGQPVPSLTADDFEIEEEGDVQEIRSFQFVRADGQPDADDEVSLTIRSRSHAASEAARDNVRVFLIFWDEYHIGQMASAVRARAALMQFVRSAFGPTDLVAFMDPLTPIDALTFTRDRLELFERTRRLIGRSGVYVPTRSAVEDAHLERGDIERLRSEVTVSALKSAVVHLGGLRDGRKAIILVSEGLRGMMRDGQSLLTDLVRTANDNNTAIYNIDPRGFGPQRFASMLEGVAEDTGGQYYRSNDLGQALRQVVTESSGFYLLGYSATGRPLDGRFHKIRVRVKPPGLDVRARSGYLAPSIADMERARVKAAETEVPPEIVGAFLELPKAAARRAADVWVGTSLESGRPAIRVSWLPRPVAGPGATRSSRVTVVASHNGKEIHNGAVAASGVVFEAPSGPVKLTVNVLDAAGETIDRDARTIDVPDPAATPLWISTPRLFRTQNALEFRNLDRSAEAVPFASREFVRTDRLNIRFAVNGTAAAGAEVRARIVSQWGKDLNELPLAPRAADDAPFEIDLPLSSVARGDFLIAITATSGPATARSLIPIRIVR